VKPIIRAVRPQRHASHWTLTIEGSDDRGAFELMRSVRTPDAAGLLAEAMQVQADIDRMMRQYRRLVAAWEAMQPAEVAA